MNALFFEIKYFDQYPSLDFSRFIIFSDTQFSIYLNTYMHKTFNLNLDFSNYRNALKKHIYIYIIFYIK